MSKWYFASATNGVGNSDISLVPNPGEYADLETGDKCFVLDPNGTYMTIYSYNEANTDAENIPQTVQASGNVSGSGLWELNKVASPSSNGFALKGSVTFQFHDHLRQIVLTAVDRGSDSYEILVKGAPMVIEGTAYTTINDIEGLHWVYFDENGVLQTRDPRTDTDDLILENCLVCNIYWDQANQAAIILGDERHGSVMSSETHYHLHEIYGSQWESGIAPGNLSVDGTGVDADAQCSISDGEFHDEDIEIEIIDDDPQNLDPIAYMPIYYQLGATGTWRREAADNFICTTTGGGNTAYNLDTGGTWSLEEVANNKYSLTHIFASNDIYEPMIILMGQNTYNSLNAARTGAETELLNLNTVGLPSAEWVPIATMILQTNNVYANDVNARVRSTDLGDDYIDWRGSSVSGGGGTSTNDHQSLSNLQGGTPGEYYHLTNTQHTNLTSGNEITEHTHDRVTTNSGLISLRSGTDGASLYHTTGDTPVLYFKTSAGVNTGYIRSATTTSLQANVGSSLVLAWHATEAGPIQLYHGGNLSIKTDTNGMVVRPSSGESVILYFQSQAAANQVRLVTSASTFAVQILNGGDFDNLIYALKDDGVTLYYNDKLALDTAATGITVRHHDGYTPLIRFEDGGATPARAGHIYMSNTTPTEEQMVVQLGESAVTSLICSAHAGVQLYYVGALALQSTGEGASIYSQSNLATYGMFDSSFDKIAVIEADNSGGTGAETLRLRVGVSDETVLLSYNGGTTSLYYNDDIAIGSAQYGAFYRAPTGSEAQLTAYTSSGTSLFKVTSTSTETKLQQWSSTSWEIGIEIEQNSSVKLYYNNLQSLSTHADGAAIQSTVGTNPSLYFATNAGAITAKMVAGSSYTDIMTYASSYYVGIRMRSAGATELWHNNLIQLATTEWGITVKDTSGNDAGIRLYGSSDDLMAGIYTSGSAGSAIVDLKIGNTDEMVLRGREGFETSLWHNGLCSAFTSTNGFGVQNASSSVRTGEFSEMYMVSEQCIIINQYGGGKLSLYGRTAVGNNAVQLFSGDPDGSATLFFAGTAELVTLSGYVRIMNGLQISASGPIVEEIDDDDAMTADSAVYLCTQQSIKAYVDDIMAAHISAEHP